MRANAFSPSGRTRLRSAVAVLLYAGTALGEPIPAPQSGEASSHFQRGYELSQSGAFEEASRHFEAAYALEPSPTVLYNLGQTYAASGQPVEALAAFRNCLKGGDGHLPEALRERVLGAIQVAERRIGRLTISVSPPSATVWIDGRRFDQAALLEPVELKSGSHVVSAEFDGFESRVQMVDVFPERDNELLLVLQRHALTGHIAISCLMRGMALRIDGVLTPHRTPLLTPVTVAAGKHTVTLSRAGYRSETFRIDVPIEGTAQLRCLGEIDADAPASTFTTVILKGTVSTEAPLAVYVDGRAAAPVLLDDRTLEMALRLPIGPQSIEIRRRNFETWRREITLSAQARIVLQPRWVPTAAYREELNAAAEHRSTWSRLAWGAGASTGLSAAILGFAAKRRHDDWMRQRNEVTQSSIYDPEAIMRLRDSQRRALSIQRLNDTAIGLGVLATVILGTAAWLQWSTGSALEAYPTRASSNKLPEIELAISREGARFDYKGSL